MQIFSARVTGAHLAHPDRSVLAVRGDGSFLMNSYRRWKPPCARIFRSRFGVTTVRVDQMEDGHGIGSHDLRGFWQPRFCGLRQKALGPAGYRIEMAAELLPTPANGSGRARRVAGGLPCGLQREYGAYQQPW